MKTEILKYGLNVFNKDKNHFRLWLNCEIPALGNKKPSELLQTEEGMKQVYTTLARIDYGLLL